MPTCGCRDPALLAHRHPRMNLLLGAGDGTFQAPKKYVVLGNPSSLAVGDFNGDRDLDLVLAGENGRVTILLNDANWGP